MFRYECLLDLKNCKVFDWFLGGVNFLLLVILGDANLDANLYNWKKNFPFYSYYG